MWTKTNPKRTSPVAAMTTLRPMVEAKNATGRAMDTDSAIVGQDSAAASGRGGLALGFELVPGEPGGGRTAAGHIPPDAIGEHVVLDHSGEVPLRRDDVARLVIAGLPILGFLLLPPPFRASDVGLSRLEVEGGHAGAREVELIGAVVVPLVGLGLVHHGSALALSG